MNNEDFDRKMEFIVNQQAQFAVAMERLKESQAQTEKNVAQNTETAAQTLEAVAQTAETVARLANVTYEGFKQTFASFKEIDAKIEALVNSQIRADDIQITSMQESRLSKIRKPSGTQKPRLSLIPSSSRMKSCKNLLRRSIARSANATIALEN